MLHHSQLLVWEKFEAIYEILFVRFSQKLIFLFDLKKLKRLKFSVGAKENIFFCLLIKTFILFFTKEPVLQIYSSLQLWQITTQIMFLPSQIKIFFRKNTLFILLNKKILTNMDRIHANFWKRLLEKTFLKT